MGNKSSSAKTPKRSVTFYEDTSNPNVSDDSEEWTTESEYTVSEEETEEVDPSAQKNTVQFVNKMDSKAIVHSELTQNLPKSQRIKNTKSMNICGSSSKLPGLDENVFQRYFEEKYLCPSTKVVQESSSVIQDSASIVQDTASIHLSDSTESDIPLPSPTEIDSVLSFGDIGVFKQDSELCPGQRIFSDGMTNKTLMTSDYFSHPTTPLQHPELSGSWVESMQRQNSLVVFNDRSFIACFGGITSPLVFPNSEIAMKIFAFDGNTWMEAGKLLEPRYDAAACTMGSAIFVTGGCNPCMPGGAALSSVWYLCPQKLAWTKLADMKQARRLHALVRVGQRIYAIGGQVGDKILNSVEYYEPKTGTWEEAPSMSAPRAGAGVAVVKNNIWVCGGLCDSRNGVANKLTDEVEVFDVAKKMWRTEKQLTLPRAFGDLINIKDKLYFVGGVEVQPNHGLRVVASVICRCAKTGTWKHWINLKCRRCHTKAVYRDPILYVVGGEKEIGGPPVGTLETVDIKTGKGSQISMLPHSMTGFCCLKLHGA